MAHNKVFGFCESGCKVEVLPKSGGDMTGSVAVNGKDTAIKEIRIITSNGDIALCIDQSRGIYDYANKKWVVKADKDSGEWIFTGKAQGIDGTLDFGKTMKGLKWQTADGTLFRIRPYTDGNLFQIIRTPPGGVDINAFAIDAAGRIFFGEGMSALAIEDGGTGARNADDACANIGAYSRYGGLIEGDIDFADGDNGIRWTTDDGASFVIKCERHENVFRIARISSGDLVDLFSIDKDGNVNFGSGALPVKNGGTGATDVPNALLNFGLTAKGVDIQADDAESWESQAKAYIVEKAQSNRVTMFELGWQGKSYGAAIAWKSVGEIHVIVHNTRGTGAFKLWRYYISTQTWVDTPLSVISGGTGAIDGPSACANIGAVKKTGDTMTGDLHLQGNDTTNKEFRVITPNGDIAFCVENARGIYDYANNKWVVNAGRGSADWTFNGKAQGIVGTEIQCGVAEMVNNGVNITFPEPFSGVPVVTAANGTRAASVLVRNITNTGCNVLTGDVGDVVQWQAIYKG